MAANVETMFSVREKPWHGLGVVVEDAPSSKDALNLAGLDWRVVQKPLFTNSGLVEGYKANVRDSDNSVLGVVTDRYKVVQNTEALHLLIICWEKVSSMRLPDHFKEVKRYGFWLDFQENTLCMGKESHHILCLAILMMVRVQ